MHAASSTKVSPAFLLKSSRRRLRLGKLLTASSKVVLAKLQRLNTKWQEFAYIKFMCTFNEAN